MLVNCVAYENGEKVADIPLSDIRSHLQGAGSFVWVALRDPDNSELARVEEEFQLHELAVEDARNGHQRPKLEEYGSSLFVVLHVVERSSTNSPRAKSPSSSAPATSSRCGAIPRWDLPTSAGAASASPSSCATVRPTCSTR